VNAPLASAQTFAALDSAIAATTTDDSLLASLHVRKAFKIHRENPDELYKAIASCEQAIKIAKKANVIRPQLAAYNKIAILKTQQGKYEEAIQAYQTFIVVAKNSLDKASPKSRSNREKAIIGIEGNIANIRMRQGKKDEALKTQLAVTEKLKKLDDKIGQARSLTNISIQYLNKNEYRKSLEYLQKAKKLIEGQDDKESIAIIYGNMSTCYDGLNMSDSSIHYAMLCKNTKHNNLTLRLTNDALLASQYSKIKEYQKSNALFKELFKKYKTTSDQVELGYFKLLAAESYIQQNNYTEAERLFNEASNMKKTGRLLHAQKIGEIGVLIKKHNKDYEDALKYQNIYQTATDSIQDVIRDSNFREIETKYEVVKKEKKIEAQEVKIKNYSAGIVGLIALVLIASLLYYYTKKQAVLKEKIAKQEAKEKEREIEELRKENKLISMAAMIEGQEEERKRIAQDLHDNIGTLMTSIKMKFLSIQKEIESIAKMNIADELDGMINSASQEVRRISHRMTPKILEHAGLHDSVKELEVQLTENDIEVKSNIEALHGISNEKMELNIYRIVQEAYNNISKHSSATTVSIVSSKTEEELTLRIRDNGKGISQEKWNDKNTLGLNGIKSRVNYLNGEIKLVEDSGTHFKITIPLV
jgi:signal transduction histidine kinase